MNILLKIKNFFVTLLGVLFFAFALVMTLLLLNYNDYGLTQFDNTTLVIINDDIANDNYEKGDLVLVKKVKIENISLGDEIFAYNIDKNKEAHISIGNVGEVYPDEDGISYENGNFYSMDFVAGKMEKKYSTIGDVVSIVGSKWGFLFIVLVPGFLIFIYEIYALIIEIKYNED